MTVSAEGRVEDLLEKNLITLTRVTFTENDLMQGVSLNHCNADFDRGDIKRRDINNIYRS